MKKLTLLLLYLFCFFSHSKAQISFCTELPAPKIFEHNVLSPRAVASPDKYWLTGQTIRIRFINGSTFLHNKVKQYSIEWCRYANLKLEFVQSGYAEIRTSFDRGKGHKSRVGTDANDIPQNQSTMNFDFRSRERESAYRSTILHEFGHALGLQHEHQSPKNGVPWNISAVYAYYARTESWNKRAVDDNILMRYSNVYATDYDRHSIMHYFIPNEITLGNYEVPENTELSYKDKKAIAEIYPGGGSPPVATFNGWYRSRQADIEWVYVKDNWNYVDAWWYFEGKEEPDPLRLQYYGKTQDGGRIYGAYYNPYLYYGQTYYKNEVQIVLSPNGEVDEYDIDHTQETYLWYDYDKHK